MKLLGRYPKKVAYQYKELLLNEGIEVNVEGSANLNPFGNLDSTYDSLFVPEGSYEQADDIIKDYEMKNQIELKKDVKEANRSLFYVLLAVVLMWILVQLFFQ